MTRFINHKQVQIERTNEEGLMWAAIVANQFQIQSGQAFETLTENEKDEVTEAEIATLLGFPKL